MTFTDTYDLEAMNSEFKYMPPRELFDTYEEFNNCSVAWSKRAIDINKKNKKKYAKLIKSCKFNSKKWFKNKQNAIKFLSNIHFSRCDILPNTPEKIKKYNELYY